MSFTAAAIASAGAAALGIYQRELAAMAEARRVHRMAVHGPRLAASPRPAVPHAGKCECCGARDWVVHAGRSVCSYCRNGADAVVPLAVGATVDECRAAFDWVSYHNSYAFTGREALAGLTVE